MSKEPSQRQVMYRSIIEHIFFNHYQEGDNAITFERSEIPDAATALGVDIPKNLGDVPYSFRYRAALPDSIVEKAPSGHVWIIRSVGRSRYRFVAVRSLLTPPNPDLAETKVPDATPGIITKYTGKDEQALLVKVRYNRLIDLFSGVTCYSLQNHLRTTVPEMGQVETDELYVGVDRRGIQYVFPVQAKGGRDRLNVVQIEQDLALCAARFPGLVCRPIGAQFMEDEVIALFEFEESELGVRVASERHYRLVPPDQITEEDLKAYRQRLE